MSIRHIGFYAGKTKAFAGNEGQPTRKAELPRCWSGSVEGKEERRLCYVLRRNRFLPAVAEAINVSLTLRNWLIGWHIAEYELEGEDRGQYGERLFAELANCLTSLGLSNCNRRQPL